MSISLRLSNEDSMLIKKYAEMNGLTVSDFIRRAVLEKIEDEYDLKCYYEAIEEYKKNPVSYTLDEIEEELGLK